MFDVLWSNDVQTVLALLYRVQFCSSEIALILGLFALSLTPMPHTELTLLFHKRLEASFFAFPGCICRARIPICCRSLEFLNKTMY